MSNLSPVVMIWLAATALYLLFRLWYDGLRRPLSAREVEALLLQAVPMLDPTVKAHTAPATLRSFLEADDGREFIMCNLVKLHSQPMPHPLSGQPTPPLELLQAYIKPFLGVLFKHGGHPGAGGSRGWRPCRQLEHAAGPGLDPRGPDALPQPPRPDEAVAASPLPGRPRLQVRRHLSDLLLPHARRQQHGAGSAVFGGAAVGAGRSAVAAVLSGTLNAWGLPALVKWRASSPRDRYRSAELHPAASHCQDCSARAG